MKTIDFPPGLTEYFSNPDCQNYVFAVWKGKKVVDWYLSQYAADYRCQSIKRGRIEKVYKSL